MTESKNNPETCLPVLVERMGNLIDTFAEFRIKVNQRFDEMSRLIMERPCEQHNLRLAGLENKAALSRWLLGVICVAVVAGAVRLWLG